MCFLHCTVVFECNKLNVYQNCNSILISKIRLIAFSKMANIDPISFGTNKTKINPKQLPNNIRYIFQIINYKCATNCSIYWILYPVHSIGEAFPIIEEENKLPGFFDFAFVKHIWCFCNGGGEKPMWN